MEGLAEPEPMDLDLGLIVSNLPADAAQRILSFLPTTPEAFRTSVLCCRWRYHCTLITKLIFDDHMFHGSPQLPVTYKLSRVVCAVLLKHQSPLSEFSLSFSQLYSCQVVNTIVDHLAIHHKNIKSLTLMISGIDHKLPVSFFTLKHMTHLRLQNCLIQPPPWNNGFPDLTSLQLLKVSITFSVLRRLLRNCDKLKCLVLLLPECLIEDWPAEYEFGFRGLRLYLPGLEYLQLSSSVLRYFGRGSILQEMLLDGFLCLRVLCLSGLCFGHEVDALSSFYLAATSPNLEKISISMFYPEGYEWTPFVEVDSYGNARFDELIELEMRGIEVIGAEIAFVKLVLDRARKLKKVRLAFSHRIFPTFAQLVITCFRRLPRASGAAVIEKIEGY